MPDGEFDPGQPELVAILSDWSIDADENVRQQLDLVFGRLGIDSRRAVGKRTLDRLRAGRVVAELHAFGRPLRCGEWVISYAGGRREIVGGANTAARVIRARRRGFRPCSRRASHARPRKANAPPERDSDDPPGDHAPDGLRHRGEPTAAAREAVAR